MSAVAKTLGLALVAVIALAVYLSAFVLPKMDIHITQYILFYFALAMTAVILCILVYLTLGRTDD